MQVYIDKQFVYNTAENLISNALRYAENKVTVKIVYQEKQMILTVCDDGNGFPATILRKAFHRFLAMKYPIVNILEWGFISASYYVKNMTVA